MVLLEARNIVKCYTAVPAVNGVTFSMEPGEVLGCVGPNGSGKSTIVRMLTGLIQPTSGEVLSGGANIQKNLVGYREQLGYVPEEPELYPFLSGWEYLELVGTLRGLPRAALEKKIGAMLELFSLSPAKYVAIGTYSKGMRQRILLIAALLHDPTLLIFDEPLSGLVKNLIKSLGERGKAAVEGEAATDHSPCSQKRGHRSSHARSLSHQVWRPCDSPHPSRFLRMCRRLQSLFAR
jgi:ABC-2 type transport system ATP-binding protein